MKLLSEKAFKKITLTAYRDGRREIEYEKRRIKSVALDVAREEANKKYPHMTIEEIINDAEKIAKFLGNEQN